jgi:hypothetical protein
MPNLSHTASLGQGKRVVGQRLIEQRRLYPLSSIIDKSQGACRL